MKQELESGEDIVVVKNKDGKKVEVLSKKSCPILDIVKRIGKGNNSNGKERNDDLKIFDLLMGNKVDLTLKRCIVTSKKTGSLFRLFLDRMYL